MAAGGKDFFNRFVRQSGSLYLRPDGNKGNSKYRGRVGYTRWSHMSDTGNDRHLLLSLQLASVCEERAGEHCRTCRSAQMRLRCTSWPANTSHIHGTKPKRLGQIVPQTQVATLSLYICLSVCGAFYLCVNSWTRNELTNWKIFLTRYSTQSVFWRSNMQ